jgi:oxygen-independent coproporphyrinogen-3 oxidase
MSGLERFQEKLALGLDPRVVPVFRRKRDKIKNPTPFGVYVHWPFCASKCPYCDFNSHVRPRIDEDRWTKAILREWETLTGKLSTRNRTVTSIFFGGGTPSLMKPAAVATVLNAIAAKFPLDNNVEITLEANPTSVEAERFRGYRDAGVNRLSLGVQSLEDQALRQLGRLHTAAEAMSALATARGIFDRVSFDLIYARPGQSLAAWRRELSQALSHGATHLSVYQLTFEEGTPFHMLKQAGKITPLDDDLAADMFEETQTMLEAAHMPAYEISNHAVEGQESRHNLLYWRYGEYLGLGPGAHGRIETDEGLQATTAERNPEAWAAQVERNAQGPTSLTPLTETEQGTEALLMGMRLAEGIDRVRIERLQGQPFSPEKLNRLATAGLIEHNDTTIRATTKGRCVLNTILAELSP